jgi:hypothetical protein
MPSEAAISATPSTTAYRPKCLETANLESRLIVNWPTSRETSVDENPVYQIGQGTP